MREEEILRGIGYEKEEETKWAWGWYKNEADERIYFNDESKEIELKNMYYEDFAIGMEELKALYEICKERGWIE